MLRGAVTLAAVLALAAPRTAAQCSDPRAPSGGFKTISSPSALVTYSDGYKTKAIVTHPTARSGTCGWPLLVLVPGLGANRFQMLPEASLFAQDGYAVVSYDVRGQGDTKTLNPGKGSYLWALDEWIDLAEIIEWTRTTYRGIVDPKRVAVFGDSQGGIHAWAAAAYSGKRPPANPRRTAPFPKVDCVVPRIFVPQTIDVLVPGGESFFFRLGEFAYTANHPSMILDATFKKRIAAFIDADDPSGCVRYLKSIPGKDFTRELATSKVPIFWQGSWLDLFMPADRAFAALSKLPAATPRRVLISTGFHGTPLNNYELRLRHQLSRDWFDRFLKSSPAAVERGPAVLTATIPAEPANYNHPLFLWRHRADVAFPSPTVSMQRWYMRDSARLSPVAPTGAEGPNVIGQSAKASYGPRDFQRDKAAVWRVQQSLKYQGMRFLSPALTAPLDLAGNPTVILSLEPKAKHIQFGVRLFARFGKERQLISWGGRDLRNAQSGKTSVMPVTLSLAMCVVPKGAQLELEIGTMILQAPGKVELFGSQPVFSSFGFTVRFGRASPSWIDLPLRPRSEPDLSMGTDEIPVAAPTREKIFVRSPTPSRPYVMLCTFKGQSPTSLAGGSTLWLERDIATDIFLAAANTTVFERFIGLLDARGSGEAVLDFRAFKPLPSFLVGANLTIVPIVFGTPSLLAGAPLQIRFK